MTKCKSNHTNLRTTLVCSSALLVTGLSITVQAADPSVEVIGEQSFPSTMIQTIDLAGVDTTNGLSVSLCVNPQNPPTSNNEARYISQATGISSSEHNLMIGSKGGKVRARLKTDDSSTVTVLSDSDVIDLGEWNHVVMTYDNNDLTLFHNKSVVKTEIIPGMAMLDPTVETALGSQPKGAGRDDGKMRDLVGSLSHVKVFNVALTSSEIDDLAADCSEPVHECPEPFYTTISSQIQNNGNPDTILTNSSTQEQFFDRWSCEWTSIEVQTIDLTSVQENLPDGVSGEDPGNIFSVDLSITDMEPIRDETLSRSQAKACGILLGCTNYLLQP